MTKLSQNMSKTITLTDEQIPLWESFLSIREQALEKELASIRALKTQNILGEIVKTFSTTAYSKTWTTLKKIEYALNFYGDKKFLTSTQIVNIILNEEPEKVSARRQLMSGVSSVLALNNGTGKHFNRAVHPETKENLYGLMSWAV